MNFYEIKANTIDGDTISMDNYKGKVLLVVNTASKCGFTPQFEGLESLYKTFASEGLEILGFPCNQFKEQDPGSSEEIKSFCQLNYGVTFLLFEKVDVRGENAHPIFVELTKKAPFPGWNFSDPVQEKFYKINEENYPEFSNDESIKWNFTKFLIDRQGNVVKRFEPWETPDSMADSIRELL
ncbi:glutathione peroxidase [Alkalibacter rhizosphaerae]|uniref:Glutathione peroxidase n=1 Tax=Alkalibacter rhizosphaerae TaxID=2815577 RepID=A0A974XGZ3_9FIRM|nr:glutathione peroxidase [Alkalibacter rhizosphaerae]QSX08133.1 glutathione peroxidase [Alkalibacter rhizosphaerae]